MFNINIVWDLLLCMAPFGWKTVYYAE